VSSAVSQGHHRIDSQGALFVDGQRILDYSPRDIYGRGIMPDTLQGTLDLLVLKTLEREPNHGFGIALRIQTVSDGLLKVEEGSLYPALHRLCREKLIASSWKVTENGRRARYYRLTPAGAKRLAEAAENWASLTKGVGKILKFA
jgi:PadR family transcriptional regulator, regulatory protein PadR